MDSRPQQQTSQEGDAVTHHLPLHLRQDGDRQISTTPKDASSYRKKFPESLHFSSSNFRMRSRTASTRSSISSAYIPDSATACSPLTLASPLSSIHASDIQDRFACHTIDGSTPPNRFIHRHRPSSATCSTFINDDDDGPAYVGYSDIADKIRKFDDDLNDPIATTEIEIETHSPANTPIKEEDDLTPGLSAGENHEWAQSQTPCASPGQKSESSAASSSYGDVTSEDADGILDYTLQVVYGIELAETRASTSSLRQIVSRFIQELGEHVWQAPCDTQGSQTMSTPSSSTTPSTGQGGENSQATSKRKKQANGEDGGGDEFSDGEGSGYLPFKRLKPSPKEEENLRLSCPYRKRNPHRFNVRDHHSCAMTYFPKFAELRQHIVKQHKRDDPSAFVCDRCTRDFRTRKELRDHQRQPKEQMCDISDHDPESGIDGPTSNKLLSRKRVSGSSPDVQWKEIWNILFPDDDDHLVRPYHFTPVIEHFELSAHYLEAFNFLRTSLRDKISNPATLETLSTKFHQCFVETVERCVTSSQSMPYTNRSNKRNEPTKTNSHQSLISRKPPARGTASRPDSGVVIDDGSEESGSMVGSSTLGHRDSVRTVRSYAPRRGSNLVPKDVIASAAIPRHPAGLDESPIEPLPGFPLSLNGSGMSSSTTVDVEAWTHDLAFNQHGDTTFGLPDQWVMDGNIMVQPEFGVLDESLLYSGDFCSLDDSYANIHPDKAEAAFIRK